MGMIGLVERSVRAAAAGFADGVAAALNSAKVAWGAGKGVPREGEKRPGALAEVPARLREYQSTYDPLTGAYRIGAGAADFGSVEVEVGELYRALVNLLRPMEVLETGTYRGYSTCCLAAALRDLGGARRVTTIDPTRQDHLWTGSGLEDFITWVPSRSRDAAGALRGRTFDLLVLDSDHTYDTIMEELILYEPMLRVGGVMALHDSLFFDGVGAAVVQLRRNPRFETVTLDTPRTHGRPALRPPGLTLVRKNLGGEPRLEFEEAWRGVEAGSPDGWPLIRKHAEGWAGVDVFTPGAGASR